jgi:hypothetical protein
MVRAWEVLASSSDDAIRVLRTDVSLLGRLSDDLNVFPGLKPFLDANPNHFETWRNIQFLSSSVRGNPILIQKLKTLKDDFSAFSDLSKPWNIRSATTYYHLKGFAKSGSVKGGHFLSDVGAGPNAHIRILDGTGSDIPLSSFPTDQNGVAQVLPPYEIHIAQYVPNPDGSPSVVINRYRRKSLQQDGHTFFPSSMTYEEIMEQIASARANPIKNNWDPARNGWEASAENGMIIRWYENSGVEPNTFFPKKQ